jgi:hypothetical protein
VIVGATLAGLYLLLYLISGFDVVAGVIQASANNARLLSVDPTAADPRLTGLPPLDHYMRYLALNLVPFAWYIAPWGFAALLPVISHSCTMAASPHRLSSIHVLALSVLVLVAGMWLGGLFVREVERIWGFVYPLLTVVMVQHIWQGTEHERLWRAGLYLSLFFAQSAIMRMLLNTYW